MARAPVENQLVLMFWMMVMQALVIYDYMMQHYYMEAHPTHSSTTNTPNEATQGRGPRAKRKRGKPMDDATSALKIIAQSSQQIAIAFKKQATQSHVNVQAILDKVRGLGFVDGDVMDLMQIFVHDKEEGRLFLEINDEVFLRSWVNRKLGK